MKTIITFAAILFCVMSATTIRAQSLREILAAKKAEAKAKIQAKLDQKTSNAMDSVIGKPEKIIKNKKNKKAKTNTSNSEVKTVTTGGKNATETIADAENVTMNGDGLQTVIQTNILCDAGKKKVETILKKQDGIKEVKTNIKNGEIAIRYSSDGTSYTTLLQLINEQGFIADGNKPLAGAQANPCKK